jgi:multidrug transporter EmrE-like cation transporter
MLNYLILFITLTFAVAAQILLKKGASTLGEIATSGRNIIEFGFLIFKNAYILGGAALLAVAFVVWVWLLSRMQLNIAYPIAVSFQIVLLSTASWFLFRESLSITQIGGLLVIILGIFLILRSV